MTGHGRPAGAVAIAAGAIAVQRRRASPGVEARRSSCASPATWRRMADGRHLASAGLGGPRWACRARSRAWRGWAAASARQQTARDGGARWDERRGGTDGCSGMGRDKRRGEAAGQAQAGSLTDGVDGLHQPASQPAAPPADTGFHPKGGAMGGGGADARASSRRASGELPGACGRRLIMEHDRGAGVHAWLAAWTPDGHARRR